MFNFKDILKRSKKEMTNWSKEEKNFINALLYSLLNDTNVNEWEHKFLKSIAEREQVNFTDKQREKIIVILDKCDKFEYRNLLRLIVDNGNK